MSSTITARLDLLDALARELAGLADELADDADRCARAAGALSAGLGRDEGLTAGAAARAWATLARALSDGTRSVAAALAAAVAAYRLAEQDRAEQLRPGGRGFRAVPA
ncbi:hypothetical protein GCM10010531_42240 [Blastococcus jejuensis]|uniref:Excreted virulence factor EspC, type VII ESX diderm n=1 Tax=Blastococcus jejuensis TaxID=351224 RepID=A0ABP6PMG5_9ACTN